MAFSARNQYKKILMEVVNKSSVENVLCEMAVGCRIEIFSNRGLHLDLRVQNSGRRTSEPLV